MIAKEVLYFIPFQRSVIMNSKLIVVLLVVLLVSLCQADPRPFYEFFFGREQPRQARRPRTRTAPQNNGLTYNEICRVHSAHTAGFPGTVNSGFAPCPYNRK